MDQTMAQICKVEMAVLQNGKICPKCLQSLYRIKASYIQVYIKNTYVAIVLKGEYQCNYPVEQSASG